MQADRRRLNAPPGGTTPPVFIQPDRKPLLKPQRTRQPDEHRKIFLRTGVVPSASGSAYYEIPPQPQSQPNDFLVPITSSLKITCTVHGPRPLPRNASFTPNLLLTSHVKFAPFATRHRRGYVRDASERDLGVHLETALRGVVIADRWPKSACEVVITILEGEEDGWWGDASSASRVGGLGLMNVLAGCITVASAALADAGIDCVDVVSGGVAAVDRSQSLNPVIDPCPSEHDISAACVVGYLQSRDEIVELWMKGDTTFESSTLIDSAVKAACLTRTVLLEAVKEAAQLKLDKSSLSASKDDSASNSKKSKDIVMSG